MIDTVEAPHVAVGQHPAPAEANRTAPCTSGAAGAGRHQQAAVNFRDDHQPLGAWSVTTALARRQTRTIETPTARRFSLAGVAPRRTSGRRTATASIARPVRARFRSRASVSASGSSGTPLQLPPTDVATERPAVEPHTLGAGPAPILGLREGACDRRDGEDAPARREQSPIRRPARPGVKYQDIIRDIRQVDGLTSARGFRIAWRG